MRSTSHQLNPTFTIDLRLRPKQIERAYWRHRLLRNKAYDTAFVLFNLIMLITITPSWASKLGWGRYFSVYYPGWLMLFIWLAALRDAPLYSSYRVQLVVFGRVIFALFHCAAINNLKDTIYEVVVLENPHMTLLYKFLLLEHIFELPIEAGALQQPFLLQVVLLVFRALCMLFNGCTTELVRFGNTPKYITAAGELTSTWAALIQSVLPIPVPPCSRLVGRSTATLLSLTVLHFTSVVVVLYAVYINIWVDIRLWLMSKLKSLSDQVMQDGSVDVIEIGGVPVTGEQLRALHESQAAALLLCNRGSGRVAALCLHAIAVGIVCQMALLASRLFVLQLVPRLLPQNMFEEFYPLAP